MRNIIVLSHFYLHLNLLSESSAVPSWIWHQAAPFCPGIKTQLRPILHLFRTRKTREKVVYCQIQLLLKRKSKWQRIYWYNTYHHPWRSRDVNILLGVASSSTLPVASLFFYVAYEVSSVLTFGYMSTSHFTLAPEVASTLRLAGLWLGRYCRMGEELS